MRFTVAQMNERIKKAADESYERGRRDVEFNRLTLTQKSNSAARIAMIVGFFFGFMTMLMIAMSNRSFNDAFNSKFESAIKAVTEAAK